MPSGTKTKTTRFFEFIFISPPTLGEEAAAKASLDAQELFKSEGCEIKLVESWGRKRLAYPVEKHTEGWFTMLHMEGPGTAIAEVQRRMRISENYIKYQSVRLDNVNGALESSVERLKKRAKQEEERAQRAVERAARDAARKEAEEAKAAEEAAKAAEEAAKAEEAGEAVAASESESVPEAAAEAVAATTDDTAAEAPSDAATEAAPAAGDDAESEEKS